MKKNKKIIIMLAIALICALTAGFLIYNYLTPRKITIYVFRDNYDAGTTITSSMLVSMQIDGSLIVAGGEYSAADYLVSSSKATELISKGEKLRVDVVKGEPVMTTLFGATGTNSIEVRMDPKAVAVTIPVNNNTGIHSSIKAESRVNVYVSYSTGVTELLLENARVLNTQLNNGALAGITLELNNNSAITVIRAVNTGTVYCGLVNGNGYIYEVKGE